MSKTWKDDRRNNEVFVGKDGAGRDLEIEVSSLSAAVAAAERARAAEKEDREIEKAELSKISEELVLLRKAIDQIEQWRGYHATKIEDLLAGVAQLKERCSALEESVGGCTLPIMDLDTRLEAVEIAVRRLTRTPYDVFCDTVGWFKRKLAQRRQRKLERLCREAGGMFMPVSGSDDKEVAK